MVPTKTVLTYAKRAIGVAALTASVGVSALAQSSDDSSSAQYATLLQQIADMKVTIAHQEVYVETQEAEIADLQRQIEEVPDAIAAVGPMLDKMHTAINSEIETDLPFNIAERYDRLAAFKDTLDNKDAGPADKMRRALGIYDAEVSYGQTIQAYAGDHPVQEKVGARFKACQADALSSVCSLSKEQTEKVVEDGVDINDLEGELKDGNYLRYGRLSLAFMTADSSEVLSYDPSTKSWGELTGSRAVNVRRGMKMARGEAAPTVVEAPIYLAN